MLLRTLGIVWLATAAMAQDARRHPAGSRDQGLPIDPLRFRPYAAAADDACNEVFRRLWLQHEAPAEVAAVLPREGPVAFDAGWVHKKRKGGEADGRWFGGDGRQLPLEKLTDDDAEALLPLLARLRAAPPAFTTPELAVLFQHDLLRAAQRLADARNNPDVVAALWATAAALALPAEALAKLTDPLASATAANAELRAALPQVLGGEVTGCREVLRRSTRLFDAEYTCSWSRVFLRHPDGDEALASMLPTSGDGPTVPIGMGAVLVQGIVALGADGKAHATPMIVDVRTQVLVNRDGLAATNQTFTHDGIDFGIWQLERQAVRTGAAAAFFRSVQADDQDMFRDYGTLKHTTYRGQCTLCHRVTDTPEPHLAGLPVLRPHAKAAFAVTGDERQRLAELQAQKLFDALAKGPATAGEKAK